MLRRNVHYAFAVIGVLGIALAFVFSGGAAEAGLAKELSGWFWSENIGWVSANCADAGAGGCSSNYKVFIDDTTGELSGYGWSPNIGWVSFNAGDVAGCPGGGSCVGTLANNKASGWARVCAVFQSGCSGTLQPSHKTGGWDGWISLGDYGISKTGDTWTGFAWGSSVIGWLEASLFEAPPPPPPFAVACEAIPNPAKINEPMVWTASVISGGPAISYSWSLPGASSQSGTGQSVTAVYAVKGTYEAVVRVEDSAGEAVSGLCTVAVGTFGEGEIDPFLPF